MIGILLAGTALQSCSDDNDNAYVYFPSSRANALVTVKPQGDDKTVVLQLDDKTTLTPLNMKQSPFGSKEVRALCNIRLAEQQTDKYNMKVYVNWIDSILTKNMAENMAEHNVTIRFSVVMAATSSVVPNTLTINSSVSTSASLPSGSAVYSIWVAAISALAISLKLICMVARVTPLRFWQPSGIMMG